MTPGWEEIARFGRKIMAAGLTSSRFGNISLRRDDKILITCTGSMLDELDEATVVEVDLQVRCDQDARASSETCVHRAVYRSTPARAVIHTHSPYAVVLSMLEKEAVQPLDNEGDIFLGVMPIVEGRYGTEELAEAVSSALQNRSACIARGHGVFASGETLADAYASVCMAEHSAKVRYLVETYPQGKNLYLCHHSH
jgi:L-fuculose-phosphate aldolase